MPQGFTRAGGLSVTSSNAGGDPVDLQRMLSITVAIGPDELALAEADYSRFVIHHYMSRFQNWETLPTQADPVASQVTVQIGGLSLFALTVGPPSAFHHSPSQKRKGTGLQENGSPVSGTEFVYS